MKARLRIIIAASFLLAGGTSALAQEVPPPPQNDVVGPPQLKDFSLNGTVTRPAPAEPVQPPRREPAQQARPTAPDRPATRSEPAADRPRQATSAADVRPQPGAAPPGTESGVTDFPPPPEPSADGSDIGVPAPIESPAQPQSGFPNLTWILAALAAAGAAAWFFFRQRPRESLAGAGDIDAFQAESPAAAEPVKSPQQIAEPPATKPAPTGVVSTRLRPWLELEFTPTRGVIDREKAAIGFELSVYNSGSVPARNVVLVGVLINGGPMQEHQIRLFFENPESSGDRIPVIPPLQRVTLQTSVELSVDQVRTIEIEGRRLFVPMVAFNAVYGWSGGIGQTSASYLVGKQTGGEKLAPFRVDMGARIFRNLAAREHELRVRK